MVNTRSTTARKKTEESASQVLSLPCEDNANQPTEVLPGTSGQCLKAESTEENRAVLDRKEELLYDLRQLRERLSDVNEASIRVPVQVQAEYVASKLSVRSTNKTKKSTSSSIQAQKKILEFEAAQERARIQMELIDRKLAADLAAVEEKYSSQKSSVSDQEKDGKDIEQWLEQSQLELEKQNVNARGTTASSLMSPPPERTGTDGPVQQLVSALKDLTTSASVQNANLLSRISTPRELPLFYGDPMEWLTFKQAYEESTSLCNFTDKENLWRLRKCLRGPAKDTVSALLISATSPSTVMSTLELQYGNPDVILSKIMADIKKISPLSRDYYKDIVPFSIKVQNFVAAVRTLRRDEYLQGVNVADIVLCKLPTVLLSKWTDYSYLLINEGRKSRLDILSDFLIKEANKVSTCSANLLNVRVDNKRKYCDYNVNQSQTVLLQSAQNKVMNSDNKEQKCRCCRVSIHLLTDCKKFKRSLRKDRWAYVKRAGLCYKCLISHHDRQTCPAAACDVNSCGQPHHKLLHYELSARTNDTVPVTQTVNNNTASQQQNNQQSETITHINSTSCSVLLKVVNINIHGPNGVFSASALLDDGSTVSLISASLAARAGLRGRKQSLHVRGAWNNTELVCDTELVDLTLSNKHGTLFGISARSVNELNLPVQNLTTVNCENYTYLREIKNNLCTGHLKPEVLIGQDNYHLLVPLETMTGNHNEPCATRTPLGWCIHGRVMCARAEPPVRAPHSTLFIANDVTTIDDRTDLYNLHEEVRRSFAIESMGVSATKPRQNMEDQRAWDHLEQTSTLENGKWHVGLLWKDNNCVMPDSYPNAIARLKGIEQKMKKDEKYAERYKERVQHLLDNDYAEELKNCDVTPKTWYLPHFGVDNPNKKKLRLVFDAAAQTSGLSLNDYLLKGPDLLMSLFGIMLRFRENRIAVTGDIKDMFLRVKIRNEDRDALRFIFRSNYNDKTTESDKKQSQTPMKNTETSLKTYVMTSLIFGANCSPFIAQFVKNKNARCFESTMPSATAAIYTQHYMDDYIDSLPDEQTAIKLIQDIAHIHSQGNLRNWNSNSKEVLNSVPKETLGDSAVKFKIDQRYEGERTLGLIWHTENDSLGFDVSFKKIPEKIINGNQRPTKREMLRVVMSIFDVYGFLSPFTINGKIILQETWRLDINWDDQINDEIFTKWKQWICLLQSLRGLRLPRYYQMATRASETESGHSSQPPASHQCTATSTATPQLRRVAVASPPAPGSTPRPPVEPAQTPRTDDCNKNTSCYRNLQMHIFCDASIKAFCAVAYWRWIDNSGNARIAFIASKCRVAGNKAITVPRLELQAAVLAARLADTITKEHKMTARKRYFWCDSTTVLHWIRNDARNYKIYVANRLGEIDDLTQIDEWRYIPTKMNVADIATRESYDCTVLQQEWLYGPAFLKYNEDAWPRDVINPEINKLTLECVTTIQTEKEYLPVPEPTKFSSWIRLLKTMYRILTFVDNGMMTLKIKYSERKYTYNTEESRLERAERLLLRYSQLQTFNLEINLLKTSKSIPTSSKLLTLSPHLDEHGVLRAGGRIDAAADVSPGTKRPAILDGRDYIARLIVRQYHVAAAHANQETVVNNLKQKYWIIRMRPTVKNVVSKCMICKIRKCKPEMPRMGDLPQARMAHHQRPFSFCGVDLFGPMEVTIGRRREKRYGVLFTCLTIRAIHIETVSSLSTDSFIMALRRMAARRGWPLHMFSDNGTNLRGANTELKKSLQDLDEQTLMDEALNHGTKWTFIPPASPHWGGAWERLIRSVKTSLKVVLNERAPREETLLTLLAEIENIVNSRPLSHVSVEAGSMESLTPNHFLLGSSSNLPQIGVFDDSDMYLRKQWKISQRLADMYWKRWMREVLPDMIPRQKWNKEQRALQVGDLVYIVDPDGPRNVWPKGLIKEVCPGKDGRIRMVTIKTRTGLLTRSAARVARIPIGDECC